MTGEGDREVAVRLAATGAGVEADAPSESRAELVPATQRSEVIPSPSEDGSLVGQILAERYRVLGLLGEGGMGSVYRGEHVHMRNAVALKVLHPELVTVPEIVARFEREAIAAARIEDPHVVNATDFGRLDDGSFYLALEYVPGHGLDELLEHGALNQGRALRIGRQIVQALVAAHEAGIVHRDLKPENVMLVARPDDPDFVKVLDFGIAKVTTEDRPSLDPHGYVLTQLGSVFGTPHYMAPEQATGSVVDHRADLYTVGVILYEMLAGQAPFQGDDLTEVLCQQINDPPPPLPAVLNGSLVELVMAQLAKDPEQRSQSAAELLAWMDCVLVELATVEPLPDAAPVAGGGPATSPESPAATSLAGSSASRPGTVGPVARRAGVPRWALGAASVLLVGGLVVAVGAARRSLRSGTNEGQESAGAGTSSAAAPGPSARLEPLDAEVLAKAATGDPAAIEALEARPSERRGAPEWVALARGRMQLGRHVSALEAYSRALDLDQSLTKDQVLLSHVRRAAGVDESAEPALRLAALRLGSDGADLLYSVWVTTKAKTEATQLARQLVHSEQMRSQASPALAVALDLRAAESCEDFRQLLARATLHGDTRAHRVLKPLLGKRGCGPKEREDCYPCLREGSALADAIAASAVRPEPSFTAR